MSCARLSRKLALALLARVLVLGQGNKTGEKSGSKFTEPLAEFGSTKRLNRRFVNKAAALSTELRARRAEGSHRGGGSRRGHEGEGSAPK